VYTTAVQGSRRRSPDFNGGETLKDHTGNAYGLEIYAAAQKTGRSGHRARELHVSKAGDHAPTFPKVSFVTKVGDLGCGVGYYK
jgi:hypothetical protein